MNKSVISFLAIVVTSIGSIGLSTLGQAQQSPSPSAQQSPSQASPQPTSSPSTPSQPGPRQSAPSQPASTQPKVINSVHYRCDGGKGFKAVFLSNETAKTTFGRKVLTLPQVESGSGFRYSDGSVTLVGKGNRASVEVGEKVLFNNCVAGSSVRGLW